MSDCGCEGSCPVCRIGEVDDHECDSCGVVFCPKCHGVANNIKSENVLPFYFTDKCLLINALPEPDFKYFSKLKAKYLFLNAI